MSNPRFYCRPINQGALQLSGGEAHHLVPVRRLRLHDKVELFDGAGRWATATITDSQSRSVTVYVDRVQVVEPLQTGRIIIASSLAKGRRFDELVSKCTELGVDRICPVVFERTVKYARGAAVSQRYQNLAISAAKQSGRLFLPKIDQPATLNGCLTNLMSDYPQMKLLEASISPNAQPLIRLRHTGGDVAAFVGPEGGITQQEQLLLGQYTAEQVRLTDTVLRVETAAVALAAVLTAQRAALA